MKSASASANSALIKSVCLLALLCLALHGIAGCSSYPLRIGEAKLMGPIFHRSWELEERNPRPTLWNQYHERSLIRTYEDLYPEEFVLPSL